MFQIIVFRVHKNISNKADIYEFKKSEIYT